MSPIVHVHDNESEEDCAESLGYVCKDTHHKTRWPDTWVWTLDDGKRKSRNKGGFASLQDALDDFLRFLKMPTA